MSPLRTPAALPALVCAAAVACGLHGGGSQPVPELSQAVPGAGRLTERRGCDETLVALDPEKTVVLSVRVPGLLERARRAELPYREEIEIGSEGIAVRLEQGADLDYWCTDVLERPPRIDAAWVGVEGTATVIVEHRAADATGAGGIRVPTELRVRLGPAILAREDRRSETLRMPAMEIAAVVGVPGGG